MLGNLQRALHYLDQQRLRNIALRKFLKHYSPEHIALHRNVYHEVDGVLCTFPTAQFGYDAKHYPQAQRMVLINHDTEDAGIALLSELPIDETLVIKLLDDSLLHGLNKRYELQRACSFISFTQSGSAKPYTSEFQVNISTQLPPDCLPLFQANNYSSEELHHYFTEADARCYALRSPQGEVLSAAISFANDAQIHEIAALYTPPAQRRKGHALHIVRAAVHQIASLGLQLRYQVRDDNLASRNLAKACGLTPFAELTHWIGAKHT